mmetsp:Transcript_5873/g.9260  ORF Transcript_5873/g.9260 Transcript_5873/m.9260 type:complete len:82 (+) Transcript_5873:255-500(+)
MLSFVVDPCTNKTFMEIHSGAYLYGCQELNSGTTEWQPLKVFRMDSNQEDSKVAVRNHMLVCSSPEYCRLYKEMEKINLQY